MIKNDEIKSASDVLFQRYIDSLNLTRNADGSYDASGDVVIDRRLVKDGKLIIRFGRVSGNFDCSRTNLTTLEGAPEKVGGYFDCNRNRLASLKGAPKEVGGAFWCDYNRLTTLEGAPKKVGGDFVCSRNELTTLKGAPTEVGGGFWCGHNSKKFTRNDVEAVSNVKGVIRV